MTTLCLPSLSNYHFYIHYLFCSTRSKRSPTSQFKNSQSLSIVSRSIFRAVSLYRAVILCLCTLVPLSTSLTFNFFSPNKRDKLHRIISIPSKYRLILHYVDYFYNLFDKRTLILHNVRNSYILYELNTRGDYL